MFSGLRQNVDQTLILHCIGHSLGAQVCGLTGTNLQIIFDTLPYTKSFLL